MKINQPVTLVENDYDSAMKIISTTDLKGVITYVNDDFIKVSGFSEDELLNKSHNIVRHPDMPPAAFADLWQTLKVGKSWMGIVKNRCKSGDYYWVDAYVTPMFENGQVMGYQSVRVKPNRDDVARAEKLYQQLSNGKMKRFRLPSLSAAQRLFTYMILILALPGIVIGGFTSTPWQLLTAVGLISLGLAGLLSWRYTLPIISATREAGRVVDNPVMQQVYIGGTNEIGKPLLAIRMLEARARTIIGRITEAAGHLDVVVEQAAVTVQQSTQGITRQQKETDQVATAMNEMVATVREVADNAEQAFHAANEASEETGRSKQVIAHIIESNESLATEIGKTAEVVQNLNDRSKNIGVVLDVIKNIAEQTNLLALNAAIEAARAGEQGRGFAVVADEVRTLAQRTHDSTKEIENMIDGLQSDASQAVLVMNDSCKKVQTGVERAVAGGKALETVTVLVSKINNMNHHIARAAEEQSTVAEEINRNISEISQVAEESAQNARLISDANDTQVQLVQQFEAMSKQFTC